MVKATLAPHSDIQKPEITATSNSNNQACNEIKTLKNGTRAAFLPTRITLMIMMMVMIIIINKKKKNKQNPQTKKMYLFILIYIYTRELLQIYIYIHNV